MRGAAAMFSETTFLMVFGLGAACMLLGFYLVVRGVGASDSESAVKLIGIEIRASKVGPGVLFALFGLVLVVTAIAKLGGAPEASPPASTPAAVAASPSTSVPPASAPAASAPPGPAAANAYSGAGPADLVAALAQRNVHSSQGAAVLQDWMSGEGSHYRKLAEATLAQLGARRVTGAGVDLLAVNFFYLRQVGVDDEAKLTPGHAIRGEALEKALVLAHRDMNGGRAMSLGDIAR